MPPKTLKRKTRIGTCLKQNHRKGVAVVGGLTRTKDIVSDIQTQETHTKDYS